MKLRQSPEDFQVEEINTLPIRNKGSYAVYRLSKSGWTTLDAIRRICREWNLPRKNFQHAGLKDRHAQTTQLITGFRGPKEGFRRQDIQLDYLGQSTRHVEATDIQGNSFQIVVRNLNAEQRNQADLKLPVIRRIGFPNYFDDQRFGSWHQDYGFVAEPWLKEDYEQALRLAFAEIQPADNAQERREKEKLREHWGDWKSCFHQLAKSHRRSIVTYLVDHPQDFKGAWGRVDGHLRGLYLSALQSDLWNRCVSRFLVESFGEAKLDWLELKTGRLASISPPIAMDIEPLRHLELPLPSARLKDLDPQARDLIVNALAECGWRIEELRVTYPRDRFFSKAVRECLVIPEGLHGRFADDDKHPDRSKLTLSFTLPPGAYATMLIKCLVTGSTGK